MRHCDCCDDRAPTASMNGIDVCADCLRDALDTLEADLCQVCGAPTGLACHEHPKWHIWETVPEIAARLGREPADVAPLILAACQRGEGNGMTADFGRGFTVPMFQKRAPLFDEVRS